MLPRIHANRASLDRVLAFMIRHCVKLIDLAFALAALLIAAYLLYEIDVFVADEELAQPKVIQADEWALLGALLSVCMLVFAWRRFREQKLETQRRIAAERHARELAFQD